MNLKSPFFINGISMVLCTVALSGDLSMYPGSASMNKSLGPVTTFCVGRFLIDVPRGSTLSGGNYIYDFMRIEPPQAMAVEEFSARLAERERFLKEEKHKSESHLLRLVETPSEQSKIYVYWRAAHVTAVTEVDGYLWTNGVQFLLKSQAGMSAPPPGITSRQDYAVTRMRETLAKLRARRDDDIPTEPGYCFEGGFIANPEWKNEEAGIDIDIAGHPDAFVSVWFYPLAMSKHDKPLLARMNSAIQALGRLATAVRVLRKGERQVGPYKGQEFLVSAPNSGGMRGHSFIWETEGEGTLDTPALKIELTTGHHDKDSNPQKTKLSDAQAIQLWDEVLNSFRLRPTADPEKASQIGPVPSPLLPLGELVGTGSICPQTGWWQSSEAGNVEGGRRRHFKAGETMPSVVLLGSSTLWQSLRGKPPTHETATVWTLIEHEKSEDASLSADESGGAGGDAVPERKT
ncbi:hypothetical protein J2S30_003772 [Herbaspirillum rubrisubalbicans]|uniref:T6SS immunity protein Tli4 family protein n=1 Tax=Herbaspirillum rubrisubalbicans TaxID=80842 RepID=UPI00209D33A0|nr:T6SS immunity protein Tli4 family protein [Herbaspirillum rubrisubalbicans]MCP1575393.1 hypothetical protein [Herbaspirillum rubrisubalbicans]